MRAPEVSTIGGDLVQLYDVKQKDVSDLEIDLNQPRFLGDTTVGLVAELEQTIGEIETAAFVSQVGDRLGAEVSDRYTDALGALPENPRLLAEILVDIKDRIQGRFSIESATDDKIVLVNSQCPFARRVEGHPSLCMMTTNVFGRVVSDARGYAGVEIEKAIATGHGSCRVVVYLKERQTERGHDFFR